MSSRPLRRTLIAPLLAPALPLAAALAAALPAQPALAAGRTFEAAVDFDIQGGGLDAALAAYAAQSHVQLIYSSASVRGRAAPALKGRMRPADGLARLLAGSDLVAEPAGDAVVVAPRRAERTAGPVATASRRLVSPGGDPVESSASGYDGSEPRKTTRDAPVTLGEVVVTGTLIHGPGRLASPVVTITREEIEASGRATLGDVLAALPQNFGGTATPATSLTGADRLGTNTAAAQGVNLHGLGAPATLVLIDGRRMAGTGSKGDFADISSIPTAAIARVEVLLDGASALYGSDAVGGVVNVILRDDVDGGDARARLGIAPGGVNERQVSQTLGRTWASGHALLAYEFYHRDRLPADKRAFAADADLRPLGGTDHRQFYSHPGNLMVVDRTGAVVPGWAIPPGQAGTGLTPQSFLPGQVNLENQLAQTDILPDQTRHSLYASAGQDLASWLTASGEALYSRRAFAYAQPGSVALMSVNRNNPFYVSPNGAASEQIAYSFTDELGPVRVEGISESLGLTGGLTARLGRSWTVTGYGAYALQRSHDENPGHLNTRFLQEALGAIPDDPATAYSAARDGYFNPYGDGGANGPGVLAFIGSGYARHRYDSRVATFNVQGDGALVALPGGDLKVAVGAQLRKERFATKFESLVSRATPTFTSEGPFSRTVSAAFLELRAPITGPDNALPGLQRLELSLAGRLEHYDDVGTTRNPKIGLVWSPIQDLALRASYGTSFRAPALPEVFEIQDAGPALLPVGASQRLVLLRVGGNLDLKPETARSWTAGLEWTPSNIPGVRVSASWFDTRFTNKIAQPVSDDIYNALSDPTYAPFIQPVNPANPADLALVRSLLAQSHSANAGLFPAEAYTAIVDARQVNTGGLWVQGVDLTASRRIALGADTLDLAVNGTYLIHYRRQVTPDAPFVELAGRPGQPPRFRAQGSGTWTHGPYALGVTLNYQEGATATDGRRVGDWTTVDAQLRWQAPATTGPLKAIELSISAQNLTNADPPFYDSPQGVGFDPANADPLGRLVAVQLVKRW